MSEQGNMAIMRSLINVSNLLGEHIRRMENRYGDDVYEQTRFTDLLIAKTKVLVAMAELTKVI